MYKHLGKKKVISTPKVLYNVCLSGVETNFLKALVYTFYIKTKNKYVTIYACRHEQLAFCPTVTLKLSCTRVLIFGMSLDYCLFLFF